MEVFARCDDHGGAVRCAADLDQHAAVCWGRLAPRVAWLRTAAAVSGAGVLGLQSEHLAVTLQPIDGRWVVGLGTGGHFRELGGTYDSERLAEAAGIAAWRKALATRIEEIRQRRGGSLDWGIAVFEPSLPRVQVLVARDPDGGPATYREREPLPEAVRLSASPPAPRAGTYERRQGRRKTQWGAP